MEKEVAFQILSIEKTKEEAAIQTAYHTLLKSANPEDDPDGFKRLRMAFETAIEYSRQTDAPENEDVPKSDVALWLDRVAEHYKDLPVRYRKSDWERLLGDPVCEELDTSLEAREMMLVFLMDHIHLPHTIWKLIDDFFGYTDDFETLKQQFPENFLNYMRYYVDNDTFFPYDLFEYRSLDGQDANGDAYIEGLMAVKRKQDARDTDGCMQELEDLSAYDIYHPYEDVERLRLYTQANDTEQCNRLISLLMDKIPKDCYSRLYIGEAYWGMGQIEKAYEIWKKILEEMPEFYQAKYNIARYLQKKGDYYEARELMHELLDRDGNDERVQKMLEQVNDILIPEYRGKLERGEEDEHFPGGELVLELGWCLFQNDKLDEAISLIENFTPEQKEEYGYYNLFGRLLYQDKQYDRAVHYLKRWKEILWNLQEDGTEETKKRISRKNMAASILGACYYELGRKGESLESIKEAINVAANKGEELGSMQQMAGLLLQYRDFERAIDVCDRLIQEDDGYYPAYLIRQEACFELQKGQEVVDDYHNAISIYPGYYKPYQYAAEVFFYYGQYEDGIGVFNLAEENGVELTPRMKLYKAKLLRNLAKNQQDRDECFQLLDEIITEKGSEGYDVEDSSEIMFEKGILHWDNDDLDEAYKYIEQAIRENPRRLQYHLVCGNIHVDRDEYQQALDEYKAAEPEYHDSPSLYYGRGLCYENLGSRTHAIKCFEQALEYSDVYVDACERLSDYYNRLYHRTYVKSYLEKALAYATRQVEATENCYFLVHRGLIFMNALLIDSAIADFEKALTYKQEDWPSWNNLGCCYKYLGQFEKSISCFEKAVEYMGAEKEILPYSNMADCYEALGQYQKAIECYQKNLSFFPKDIDFWEEIGDLYYYMDKLDQALDAYEHTKTKKECHQNYYRNMGNVWIKKGDRRKGIGYYKKGIRVASGTDKARRYYQLGQLYTDELLDYKKGIYYIKHAMQYTDNYSDLFDYERYIAKSYYRMGDKKNAKKHAQKALQFFKSSDQGTQEEYINYPPYAPIHLEHFGWIYLCLGEEEKAEKYFQKMGQVIRCKHCRHQQCFESTLYMGDLHLAKGRLDLAKTEYQDTLRSNPHCNEAIAALHFIQESEK